MKKDDRQTGIEGRIVALEILMTGLLSKVVGDEVGGGDGFDAFRRSFFQSLQKIQRPIDPEGDQIWEEASFALNRLFDQAKSARRRR